MMKLKEMTLKEFNEINRRFEGYHGQSPQNFRVGFDRAAKSLNAPVRTTVHGNRVFLVRLYDPDRD